MKKSLVALGISLLLFTPTVMAANLETRTYDEGGENVYYLPITISNIAWDSIEKVPADINGYCDWAGYATEDVEMIAWLRNRTIVRTVDRINETTSKDYIFIGTAAPCKIDMENGGVPDIKKLNPINEGESFIGTISIDGKHYKTEVINYQNEVSLDEGMYLINNYTQETYDLMNMHGAGSMYWYDIIVNVKKPDCITNASAYVQYIRKITAPHGDVEQKELIAFKNQVPVIIDDRTLVPMRDIFEALDCEVTWDDSIKTVTAINKHGTTITLVIGENKMLKNDSVIELDVAPQIINDSTMIPVRAVSEALDLVVEWDDDEKIVSIIQDETK